MHQVCFFCVTTPNLVTQNNTSADLGPVDLSWPYSCICTQLLAHWGWGVCHGLTHTLGLSSGGTGVMDRVISRHFTGKSGVVRTVVAVFRENERSIQGLLRSSLRLVQCHFCHICSLEQVTVPAPSQGDDENRICLLMAKHFSKGKDIRREIPGPFWNSWPYDITHPLLHRL